MVTINSFRLRKIEQDDLAWIKELRLSERIQTAVGQRIFLSTDDQQAWYKNHEGLYLIFEVVDPDAGWGKAGYVRLNHIDHFNKSVMIGADLHQDFTGQGHGSEVYKLIFELCFRHWGMNRVYLYVLKSNEVARGLYEKLGFVVEGVQRQAIYKNGRYEDYILMAKLKEEYDTAL